MAITQITIVLVDSGSGTWYDAGEVRCGDLTLINTTPAERS